MKSLALASAFAFALLLPGRANANPIDMFGFGARATAMGGAATADAEDSSANYYNPAGLVHGDRLRIDIGYRWAQPELQMNGQSVAVDAVHGFVAGLVAPGQLGPVRYAFGAAFAIPDARLVRVRSLGFATPRFPDYDNRGQRMYLAANLALQIVKGLTIGGGVTFLSRTQGEVDLKGLVGISDPNDTQLATKIDVGLFAIRYPQFGVRWDALPWLTLGASYRHSFTLDLDQKFRIDGDIGNPGVAPIIQGGFFATEAIVHDLFQPKEASMGFSARLLRNLLVNFDATYAVWSEYPTQPTLTIELDIKSFNNLVHLPPPRSYPAPGFHDILIARLGGEWRARETDATAIDVRAGYSYEPTPVPEQTGESSLADADKHTFSLGGGLTFKQLSPILAGSLSFDAHLSATYLPTRVNHKLDPLDLTGDFTDGGTVWNFGLTMRTVF